MTVDTENGIVLGVDCYPANQHESNIILKHLEKIQAKTGINIKKLALDAGYDVGAVHRGLEVLGITGYVSCIDFSYDIFKYLPELDCFECLVGKFLNFIKLTYKKLRKIITGFIECLLLTENHVYPVNTVNNVRFPIRIQESTQAYFIRHFTETVNATKVRYIKL